MPTYTPIEIRSTLYPHASDSTLRFAIAGELARECQEHGAPWIARESGSIAIDSGGNAYTVDRAATVYVTCTRMPDALRLQDDSYRRGLAHWDSTAYAVEIPAYNAWYRCLQAGLSRDDYGRTWYVYQSREEYRESLD